jgi:hypothetical protein
MRHNTTVIVFLSCSSREVYFLTNGIFRDSKSWIGYEPKSSNLMVEYFNEINFAVWSAETRARFE